MAYDTAKASDELETLARTVAEARDDEQGRQMSDAQRRRLDSVVRALQHACLTLDDFNRIASR